MTRLRALAWTAAGCTYLLIILGGIVRITGSGLGCGDHWPLCNGHLLPPLDDIGTVIEWSHRLVASLVSLLVIALAIVDWRMKRTTAHPLKRPTAVALILLIIQVLLGAITVKTGLTPVLVVLHLGTALLLLAALLVAATSGVFALRPRALPIVQLAFATLLLGGLTANLGAAAACAGFPLCNGQVWITAGPLAWLQWTHRLFAYSLALVALVWAARSARRGPTIVLLIVLAQITLGASAVVLGLPAGVRAAHVATGAAVWAAIVLATRAPRSENDEAPGIPGPRTASDERRISSAS
jgi:heme a synthase